MKVKVTQLCPTLWHHGLYSPWNSPDQNTGEDSLSLLQGIFPTQGLNPGPPHCRQILYQLIHKGSPRIYWSGQPIPSPADLPYPAIELGSPALQADSLPTEWSGKPWYTSLGGHIKYRLWFSRLGVEPEICISNKWPGEHTTLWVARYYNHV